MSAARPAGLPLSALLPPAVQMAYHVPDPVAAAERFARDFGWGPFYLMEHIALERSSYRGTPTAFDHTSAYGQAGGLMVELITQHGEQPSALRDLFAAHETGLHHTAHFVPDVGAAVARFRALGFEPALEARTTTGVEFVMIDASRELGHMLELYERGDALAGFYDFVRRKAEGWDGSNPVRRLGGAKN